MKIIKSELKEIIREVLEEADLPSAGRVAKRQMNNIKNELARLHKFVSLDKLQTAFYHKARKAIEDLEKSL